MTENEDQNGLIAAGGWCVPDKAFYDVHADLDPIVLPEVVAARFGIRYDAEMTPAAKAANEAMRARTNRIVADMAEQRSKVIDDAALVALANGWDVHLYPHPECFAWNGREVAAYQRIGIAFAPAKHPIPTIHEHRGVDATYDEDEDWS